PHRSDADQHKNRARAAQRCAARASLPHRKRYSATRRLALFIRRREQTRARIPLARLDLQGAEKCGFPVSAPLATALRASSEPVKEFPKTMLCVHSVIPAQAESRAYVNEIASLRSQ